MEGNVVFEDYNSKYWLHGTEAEKLAALQRIADSNTARSNS